MQELFRRGLTGDGVLHSYHCDCDACDYESGYDFRGQRDSSCAGEIISRPFASLDAAADALAGLQDAAIETDAEPGWSAGFHVHVNMARRSEESRSRMLWQFLRWEDTLRYIAAGRFPSQRSNNNTVLGLLRYMLATHPYVESAPWAGRHSYDNPDLAWCEENIEPLDLAHVKTCLHETHLDNDRHSNLNISTGHGTWEFRLWNSTRAAWRMRLFVGLSQAFVTPAVMRALEDTHVTRSNDENAHFLLTVLNDNEFGSTAELLARQLAFHARTGGTDAALTCV